MRTCSFDGGKKSEKKIRKTTPGFLLSKRGFDKQITRRFDNSDTLVSPDKFLNFSREHKSCLHKLKLRIHKGEPDRSCVTRWINFVSRRKLKHLDVECLLMEPKFEVMPLSLYICETLLNLRLHRVSFGRFESISLPRLRTMRLEQNTYANEEVLESFILSCPVLEDLSIVRRVHDNVKVLRVHSQTLTRLSVGFFIGENVVAVHSYSKEETGLWIDAPRLKYLYFENEISKSKTISNTGSLVKGSFVDSCSRGSYPSDWFDLSKQQVVRNFFTGISKARDIMIFSKRIMELISAYLQVQPMPQFCNLSCLEAEFSHNLSCLRILSTFLESCPNLTSIVLVITCTNLEF
ncbi:PREDICTED: FBD-associated F-box protein At5g22730-like [Camelina sativa]|uniref:FBD-associated F-box protein At5g22730-like n=1 Tax=Camelina sativa TaxID=90675 RepID=A0ABM0VID5_CAMSA|nr:PREDICTED: FBD-associated F-box protein At5g22730-like [Camelina sativa]